MSRLPARVPGFRIEAQWRDVDDRVHVRISYFGHASCVIPLDPATGAPTAAHGARLARWLAAHGPKAVTAADALAWLDLALRNSSRQVSP